MAHLTKYMMMYDLSDEDTLMINTLNSAMDIIDNNTKQKIENMQNQIMEINPDEDNALYGQLKARGYLYENKETETDAIQRFRALHEEMVKGRRINSFTICPTMGCNLRCTYCFESNDNHVNFNLMTDGQLDSIFKYIKEQLELNEKLVKNEMQTDSHDKHKRVNSVTIFGGEPLLKQNYHVVKRITEFANDNQLFVKVITNGTNLTGFEDLIRQYKDIMHFQVTLDGAKEANDSRRIKADGSGTFDIICRNIEKLLQLGAKLYIRVNIDKENIDQLNSLTEVFKLHKWDQNPHFNVYASPVLCFDGGSMDAFKEHEFLDALIQRGLYRKENSLFKGLVSPIIGYLNTFFDKNTTVKPWKMDYCEATNGGQLVFSPDGKVTTCLTFAGKGKHTIGDFDEDGVYLDLEAKMLWSERNIFRIEKCSECKYAFLCGGGCPVSAIETNNNIDEVVCSDISATLERYVFYGKEQFLVS